MTATQTASSATAFGLGVLDPALDDDFDPLAVDNLVIDQEDMDDDNPLDTVDYPTMRNMPDALRRDAVYTPERQGSAEQAVLELLDHNPGRRPVLVSILGMCRGGCLASQVADQVDELQRNNRSVYAPATLCRMLERTGALELEMPEVAEEREDPAEGVTYLEIKERIDPVWHTTPAGEVVYASLTQGDQFRDIVLNRDSVYVEVYRAVMEAVDERPRSKGEIEELVDTFDVVKKPRRFGGHFIDMLERTDALEWNDHAWRLTELGQAMLPVVQTAAKKEA